MILVTGASGFLGQHLMRFLSVQGQPVRALYNSHPPDKELLILPHITWQKFDLLDIYAVEEAMQNVTEVYHCAAIVSFQPSRRGEMIHFNGESTTNLINQALEQGIRKMVYVSSVAALGRTKENNKEITEEAEWEESRQNSAYGLSKFIAENEVWRGIGEGLDGVIVNPSIILGAGDWNDGSPQLMKVVNSEFPFYAQGITGWVDVHDVVKAMVMLMQSDITAERFILSAGNYSYKEIFTLMAGALHKKPPHIRAGAFVTELVWRLNMLKSRLTGANAAITKETARNAQHINLYNNDKLLQHLSGFHYTPITQTIRQMAQAFATDMKKL